MIIQNRSLIGEIQQLKETNNENMKRNNELNLRLTDQFSLEKQIKEHLALFVLLFAEI